MISFSGLIVGIACSIPEDGLRCGIVLIWPLATFESAQTAGSRRITIDIPRIVKEELSRLRFGMAVDGMGCDSRDLGVRTVVS